MAKEHLKHAAVGVAEHGNSAVLVTVAAGAELLDRRRIDLTSGLPTHPTDVDALLRAMGRSIGPPWAAKQRLATAAAIAAAAQSSIG